MMKLLITNYGVSPNEPGPFVRGNIELVTDYELFEHETKYYSDRSTTLNLVLLNPITPSELMYMMKFNHQVHARICTNIFPEISRSSMLKIVNLTPTEFNVLSQISSGKTYDSIASLFNVTSDTIKKHVYNIYNKIGLHTNVMASNALLMYKGLHPENYYLLCNRQ